MCLPDAVLQFCSWLRQISQYCIVVWYSQTGPEAHVTLFLFFSCACSSVRLFLAN
ncbi:hypothetical protein BDZ91DRAFT_721471 [Kalaharituber pfeilii]|nr:hypothetical protein BDZ91DRAFT_721471 [Kalaharituber pfeilii]